MQSNEANENPVDADAKGVGITSEKMETPLCGCVSDFTGCLISCLCPCVVAGFNSARVDDRACTPCDIFSNDYQTRQSLRAKYNMDFEPLKDFIGWVCFPWCSIMQTAKEVALKKGDEPVFIKPVVKNSMEDRAKEDAPTA